MGESPLQLALLMLYQMNTPHIRKRKKKMIRKKQEVTFYRNAAIMTSNFITATIKRKRCTGKTRAAL